jgi:hypothetical protein
MVCEVWKGLESLCVRELDEQYAPSATGSLLMPVAVLAIGAVSVCG